MVKPPARGGQAMRWGEPIEQRGARQRPCPRCEARPGNPCGHWSTTRGWVAHKTHHRERIDQP